MFLSRSFSFCTRFVLNIQYVLEAVSSVCTGSLLQRYKSDELKALHRLLFNRVGKTTMIKKNLRKFNGFDFDKESDLFEKKKNAIQK